MSSYRLPDGRIPVLLSSDTADSLRREATALLGYLESRPAVTPDQVADMIFRTRVARRHRALAMVIGRDDLLDALRAIASGGVHPAVVANAKPAGPRRVGYVFPGQGSQRPGMGTLYYEHSPVFRAAVDECEVIFQKLFEISPRSYLLGDDDLADDVKIVQPALFMQMIGLAAMWRAAGVEPAVTIGHSQGEIAAACVSGIMSLADGVRVVTLRANLVGTICHEQGLEGRYSMAVVGVDREECEALLARKSGWAELSVVNSAHVIAISGELSLVSDVIATLTEEGKFAKEIRVAYPAHTSIVSKFRRELCDGLADELDHPVFAETEIPCIGATLGAPISADFPIGDYWFWNLRNRVRFDLAILEAVAQGVDTFIEIADHPALMLAIMENLSTVSTPRDFQMIGTSRRTAEDLREFTRNLAVAAVHDLDYGWSALRAESSAAGCLPLLDFPNTQMNSRHLWAPFDYPAQVADVAAVESVAETVPVRPLVEVWERLGRRAVVPPRTVAVVDPTGRSGDLVSAIQEAAPRQGATVIDLAAMSNRTGAVVDTVVVLLPEQAGADIDSAVADLAGFLGSDGWLPELDGVRDVWLVTIGGEQVLDTDVPNLFHAAAQAGFRCLAPEHIGVGFRHLDLAPGEALSAAAKAIAGAIHVAEEPELAVRDGGIYAKRLVVKPISDDRPLRGADLREVVIVGGTGEVGLDFCEQFARGGAGRITLISRSGGSDSAAERIHRIRGLGRTEVVVRSCDVTDESAVRTLAAEYRETPADLIVHAAVDYAAAAEVGPDSVRAAAAPKALALDLLVRHFPLAAEGRIMLCSSLSATIGGRGHMLYSAVNRMLDAAAAQYRSRGIACTSVQWGLWREIGMSRQDVRDRISGSGLVPMDPAGAIMAGFTTRAENVIVATADWDRIEAIFSIFGFGPLFGKLEFEAPPVAVPTDPVAVRTLEAAAPAEPAASAVTVATDTAETVRIALRAVMGMDMSEAIDGSTPLVALGLDSLQALDLRKRIESDLKRDLPVTAILGGASFDEVVSLLGR